MGHGITNRDGLFSVRSEMWHGLGTVLPDHPTREEAQQIAHPWEPVTEPVYRMVPRVHDQGLVEEFQQIEDHQAVVRSDTGDTLGVVSSTYEPVKNDEMYDIAEALERNGEGGVRYETGGSLFGGRKVWLLMRLDEPLMLKNDPITATVPYYALQNAHDGSGAFRGQALSTRIVCANTSHLADMEAGRRGSEFTFRHTRNVRDRIEEAREALEGWRSGLREWRLSQEVLLDVRLSREQEQEFVERFIPTPLDTMVSERVKGNVHRAQKELTGILRGETLEGVHGTGYAAVQAAVEYRNHYQRARSDQTRFRRTYLDRDRIVSDAVDLVREIAHV